MFGVVFTGHLCAHIYSDRAACLSVALLVLMIEMVAFALNLSWVPP